MDEAATRVLQAVLAQNCPEIRPLPDKTVHAIEKVDTFGPGRSLQGYLIVEELDGSLHRITGAELVAFAALNPRFVQTWQCEE